MPAPHAVQGSKGKAWIEFPRAWIFLGRIEGHYGIEMLAAYIEGMTAALGHGPATLVFHHWEAMSSYDSKCRKDMTDWTLARREKIARHHVFVRSKLVAMGVSTANLLLGGELITSHVVRASFDAALAAALRESGWPGTRQPG